MKIKMMAAIVGTAMVVSATNYVAWRPTHSADAAAVAAENTSGSTESKNYLVSLRNDKGKGKPGPDFPSPEKTTYIALDDDRTDYLLTGDDVVPAAGRWADQVKAEAKGGPVIIFVHGYHNDSQKIVGMHKNLKAGLAAARGNRSFCLVSFDWPTAESILQSGIIYTHDWRNSESSGKHLISDCIEVLLRAGIDGPRIHLLTHSMGGRVAEVAFTNKPPSKSIGHVMLTAADVDAPDFSAGSKILANFLKSCASFTCYYSGDDAALSYSAKYHHKGTSRLGQVGFEKSTTDAERKCVNVNCTKYYEAHVRPQDKSALTSHKWYLTPTYFADYLADLNNVITNGSSFPTREPDSSKHKGWHDLVKRVD